MPSLGQLYLCGALTLALLIAELVLGHFSHCLTLLAVTNQTLYNLLTLGCAIMAKRVSERDQRIGFSFLYNLFYGFASILDYNLRDDRVKGLWQLEKIFQ